MNPYKKKNLTKKKKNSSWKVKEKRREKGKENTCAQVGRSLPGFFMGCCCAPTYAFFYSPNHVTTTCYIKVRSRCPAKG